MPFNICRSILENIERVIVGKARPAELLLAALLAEGHVLLNDVPGVGKTLLAKSLARSIGGSFKRVQFTPDLLPADITGFNIYDQKAGQFRFQAGPVMSNVLLADEINRTIPLYPGQPAGKYGRRSGHGGRRDFFAAPPFFCHRYAEPY